MADVLILETLPVDTSIISAISYIFNSSTKYSWIIRASFPSSLAKTDFNLFLNYKSLIFSSGVFSLVTNQLEKSSYDSSRLLFTPDSKAFDHS